MRGTAKGGWLLLAGLTMAFAAWAEDAPPTTGCDDALARGVWELAIDLCSPDMLPEGSLPATRAHLLKGRAKAFEQTGDAARAAEDLAEAKKLDANPGASDPNTADFHLSRARSLHENGEDDRALSALDRAIALDKSSAQAYALRASIYLARGDDRRAQADIASATSLTKGCELKSTAQQTYIFTCP